MSDDLKERLQRERDEARADAAKQRQRADALERALRCARPWLTGRETCERARVVEKIDAALAQQPGTLEQQGYRARGEPLADHPAAGGPKF